MILAIVRGCARVVRDEVGKWAAESPSWSSAVGRFGGLESQHERLDEMYWRLARDFDKLKENFDGHIRYSTDLNAKFGARVRALESHEHGEAVGG